LRGRPVIAFNKCSRVGAERTVQRLAELTDNELEMAREHTLDGDVSALYVGMDVD
jgi:hypothetical protein